MESTAPWTHFDPDQPSGWAEQDFRDFVARHKTLYFGEHKYWTMGAPLPETDLINRKPRAAD